LNRRSFLLAAAAAAGTALARSAPAAQIDQVRFEDHLQTRDTTFRLRGAGLYYYRQTIKFAAAAFYLHDRATSEEVLGDVAKRLEMQYFRRVRGRDLASAASAVLAQNISARQLAELRPEIGELHSWYPNIRAGDRCALTYLPGLGTWLTHNGQHLGTIAGAEFAAAYFSIWFGEQPMDLALKHQLLGAG
jgi:hypothetical protein